MQLGGKTSLICTDVAKKLIFIISVPVKKNKYLVDVTDFLASEGSKPASSNLADAFRPGAGEVTRSGTSEIDDFWLRMDLGCGEPGPESRTS